MAEEQRLHPVRDIKDGDIVIFNAELLCVKRYYTLIYLTDYFTADDPDAHEMYTIYVDDRELSEWGEYSKSKAVKKQLYEVYCEKAMILPKGLSREEIFGIHKKILASRIQLHYECTMAPEAFLEVEKESCTKIKEAIARTMRSISGRMYHAASEGRTFVDIDFNMVSVKPAAFCSDGRRRETPEKYVAFVLLGPSADEMPHESLLDYIHQQLLARFPHLSVSLKKQGLIFPVMRITFAEAREELSLC